MIEKPLKLPITATLYQYCFLTKPGIIFGNAVTAAAGFALASRGKIELGLFCLMLLGLSFIIASACVFNNFIDRKLDSKMSRTQNRALVTGAISNQSALVFAAALGLIGAFILTYFANPITAITALVGLFVYVFVYSFSKYETSYCTLLGSIAGSVPPLVGYTAISAKIDLCSFLLFLIVAFWQMPHFFAIAIYRLEDYARGEIPVLPLDKGMHSTKIQMNLYIVLFIATSILFYYLGFAKIPFLITSVSLGLFWQFIALKGFSKGDDKAWARKMFLFSLIIIMAISFVIPFSV